MTLSFHVCANLHVEMDMNVLQMCVSFCHALVMMTVLPVKHVIVTENVRTLLILLFANLLVPEVA